MRKLMVFLTFVFASVFASADTFNWSYSGTNWDDGTPVNAAGTFTTDSFNGSYYQITGITGQRDGVTITALNDFGSADNELFPTAPTFDLWGLGYTAGGVEYNLYWTGIDFDEVHLESNPFKQIDYDVPSVSISPAIASPEPASSMLLVAGLLCAFRKKLRTTQF